MNKNMISNKKKIKALSHLEITKILEEDNKPNRISDSDFDKFLLDLDKSLSKLGV